MRTEKQIAASRLNGWKSNGATTSEGKARIVSANLKSGVYTESEILPWEDPESLERLEAEYYDHHRPASRRLASSSSTTSLATQRLRTCPT